jgi:hypothetical protein
MKKLINRSVEVEKSLKTTLNPTKKVSKKIQNGSVNNEVKS